MIEITDGKRTLRVPEETANATLKEKWLKNWTIVRPVGNVPNEVIQFQEAKLKEVKPEPKDETDLFKLPLSRLEEIADTLSQEQLEGLIQDPRKSVKTLAKRNLNKLRNENKRTGNQTEFTLEQWRNLENTGHARYWKIIDAGVMPKQSIEPVRFSEPVTLNVEYQLKDYRKLLDEAGIKYNKQIKNQLKLKEIYEENIPVVTTIPDKKGERI